MNISAAFPLVAVPGTCAKSDVLLVHFHISILPLSPLRGVGRSRDDCASGCSPIGLTVVEWLQMIAPRY